jgi:hypothetical protein
MVDCGCRPSQLAIAPGARTPSPTVLAASPRLDFRCVKRAHRFEQSPGVKALASNQLAGLRTGAFLVESGPR